MLLILQFLWKKYLLNIRTGRFLANLFLNWSRYPCKPRSTGGNICCGSGQHVAAGKEPI